MNILEFRQQYPQYKEVSDTELSSALHQKFYSDVDFDTFNGAFMKGAEPESESSTLSDLWSSFASGSNSLLKIGGDIYGLATGDMDNWASEQGQSGLDYWQDKKSGYLKNLESERKRLIDETEGEWSKAGTAFWETITSPSLLGNFVAEQVPMLLPPAKIGQAAKGTAALVGLSEKIAGSVGVGAAVGTGAAMQGADAGSQAYDQLMSLDDQIWRENAVVGRLIQEGKTFEEAKQMVAAGLSKDAAVSSGLVSVGLNMLPGARYLEKALVGAKLPGKSMVAKGITGFIGEAAQEGGEEAYGAYAANVATAEVDPNKDIYEGVGEAGGSALPAGIFGGIGGISAYRRQKSPIAEATNADEAIAAAEDIVDKPIDEPPVDVAEEPIDMAVPQSPEEEIVRVAKADDLLRQAQAATDPIIQQDLERQAEIELTGIAPNRVLDLQREIQINGTPEITEQTVLRDQAYDQRDAILDQEAQVELDRAYEDSTADTPFTPTPATQQVLADISLAERALDAEERRNNPEGGGIQFEKGDIVVVDAPNTGFKIASLAANIFGKRVIPIYSKRPEVDVNAFAVPGTDAIFINVNQQNPAMFVFGHELGHHMEADRPELYNELRKVVMQEAFNLDQYKQKLIDQGYGVEREDGTIELTDKEWTPELVNDVLGNLTGRDSFWEKLAVAEPTKFKQIAQTVLDYVRRVLSKLTGRQLQGGQFVKDLKRIEDAAVYALKEYALSQEPITTQTKVQQNAEAGVGNNTAMGQAMADAVESSKQQSTTDPDAPVVLPQGETYQAQDDSGVVTETYTDENGNQKVTVKLIEPKPVASRSDFESVQQYERYEAFRQQVEQERDNGRKILENLRQKSTPAAGTAPQTEQAGVDLNIQGLDTQRSAVPKNPEAEPYEDMVPEQYAKYSKRQQTEQSKQTEKAPPVGASSFSEQQTAATQPAAQRPQVTRPLGDVEITWEAIDENGDTIEITQRASDMMRDMNDRMTSLQALKDCLT